jgi:hypothetical protein
MTEGGVAAPMEVTEPKTSRVNALRLWVGRLRQP